MKYVEDKETTSSPSNSELINTFNKKQTKDFTFWTLLITQGCGFLLLGCQNHATRKNSDRQFSLQKRNNDVAIYIPVLLDILRDLRILHSALVYKGDFCPIIEHRSPNIIREDPTPTEYGVHSHSMSIAQRGHQFFLIGLQVVDNCKKIIFLAKGKELPKTLEMCKEIKQFLFSLEEGESTKLQRIMLNIQHCLKDNLPENRKTDSLQCFYEMLDEDEKKLLDSYQQLEKAVEEELPYLTELKEKPNIFQRLLDKVRFFFP